MQFCSCWQQPASGLASGLASKPADSAPCQWWRSKINLPLPSCRCALVQESPRSAVSDEGCPLWPASLDFKQIPLPNPSCSFSCTCRCCCSR